MSVEIPDALDGQRLDRVVAIITACSRADAARWVATGRVEVDGVVVESRSMRLHRAMRVSVDVPEATSRTPIADEGVDFGVIDADDDLIIVDKPPGLVVHPAPGHLDGTLVNGLLARFPDIAGIGDVDRPGIVHRLDRGTSGLLVVARTDVAYRSLVAALAAHEVHREYLALVSGHPTEQRGVIDAPIGRASHDATKMAVTTSGKPARTRYTVLKRHASPVPTTQLQCELETGRTHQIRVHLSAIDHPVVGDSTYGGRCPELPIGRPFLHARSLAFVHPVSGEHVSYRAQLPDDLREVLSVLDG